MVNFDEIKLLGIDVDGTMTDGCVYYSDSGESMMKFSRHDGKGIQLARAAGIDVFFCTSETCQEFAQARAKKLGVPCIGACTNKVSAIGNLLAERRLLWSNLAYIGDGADDLEVMQMAGIGASVQFLPFCWAGENARMAMVNAYRIYLCQFPGGAGAVKEFVEFILRCRKEEQACGEQ